MIKSPLSQAVHLRFFLPPEDLRPFVTTIYRMQVDSGTAGAIEDRLHPEWANLRFFPQGEIEAAVGDRPLARVAPAVMVGPTSHATVFRAHAADSWGIGLLPLGWSRLVDAPAQDYADRFVALSADRHLARLQRFTGCFAQPADDPASIRDRLVACLRDTLLPAQPKDGEIIRLERLLVDPAIHTVGQLGERADMSSRSLERLCNLAFGFSPQLLLRRQRFLRSLAQYMLDPSLKWIETLDSHYHDQAHFVRDFKRFMGMSPSAYAKLPHPVLGAAAHARMAVAGEAVQVLHKPPAP